MSFELEENVEETLKQKQAELAELRKKLRKAWWALFAQFADAVAWVIIAYYYISTGLHQPWGHQEAFELAVLFLLLELKRGSQS